MGQSYTDELAAWAQLRARAARRHKNLAAFLLVKEDAREAVKQGWPVMAVWAHMFEQKRITFGYETFLNYVKRYIHPEAATVPPVAAVSTAAFGTAATFQQANAAEHKTAIRPAAPGSNPSGQIPSFVFNPLPNKEELI